MACGARDSWRRKRAARSEATPMGTLTRKMRRQLLPVRSLPISRPPASGPLMVAMPMMAPKTLKAVPRSRGGKLTWMTESTCGYMSDAIRP